MNEYKEECLRRLEHSQKYKNYSNEDLVDELFEKDKEITRLNNIIDEAKKYMQNNVEEIVFGDGTKIYQVSNQEFYNELFDILDELQEMKEGNKNE